MGHSAKSTTGRDMYVRRACLYLEYATDNTGKRTGIYMTYEHTTVPCSNANTSAPRGISIDDAKICRRELALFMYPEEKGQLGVQHETFHAGDDRSCLYRSLMPDHAQHVGQGGQRSRSKSSSASETRKIPDYCCAGVRRTSYYY